MADDKMKHDEAQRNMGTKDDRDLNRQSPGRSGQGQEGGQHAGGQQGGQKGGRNLDDDDDFDTGRSGGQNRGGQNR